MGEILEMSTKELERLRILQKVEEKKLTQIQAANLLNLSDRQVRNLLKGLKQEGPKFISSKKRGKPSNRRKNPNLKKEIIQIIREKYEDFGPTLICEKLQENHQVKVSVETIRLWMLESMLWFPKQRKSRLHPLRPRRACFGELIQIDGSDHDWFEGRLPACTLIVFIDDATSLITSMYFSETETFEAYCAALKIHLQAFGRPKELYSDHFSVFEAATKKEGITQFKRVLNTLDIAISHANSPQAKGRVERANRTLQDRLVKEMRQRNICSMEEANQFLKEEFIDYYNKKFSKEPANTFDAHRPLEPSTDLSRILNRYEERTVLKDLSFQFDSTYYQILQQPLSIRGKKIEIRQINGKMHVFLGNTSLKFKELSQIPNTINSKNLNLNWKKSQGGQRRQSMDHPWKKYSYQEKINKEAWKKVI